MSMRITSGCCAAVALRTCSPSPTSMTSNPAWTSRSRRIRRLSSWSSTTRIRLVMRSPLGTLRKNVEPTGGPGAPRLPDHLVGGRQQRFRDGEAEKLGRLKVDDELELGRLQHRQVGGLGAVEDFAGIDADLTIT